MSVSDEIVIAVMGATGTGKSSFINLCSGSQLAVGDGLRSCTASVTRSKTFELRGRPITLLDTPGFDDSTVSDTDILKILALYLASMYEQGIKLRGIIYMHRISDFRVGGSSRKNFNMFCKLCGEKAFRNIIILTNMWGEVTPERGAARETELATDDLLFKPILDGGAQMLRHENSVQSAHAVILSLIEHSPVALRIQEELIDEHKDIADTGAGQELGRELAALIKKHHAQLAELQTELDEAVRTKDMQSKRELEQARKDIEERISRAERDRARISTEYAQEKNQVDGFVRGAMTTLGQEQRDRMARQEELRRLTRLVESSAADRAIWQQELRRLEDERNPGVFTVVGQALDEILERAVSFVSAYTVRML